jgi:histidinol dehydrogenase
MFAVIGRLDALDASDRAKLFDRGRATDAAVSAAVAGIIADVKANGDAELRALSARFDGVPDLRIEVPRAEWLRALDALDPAVRDALEEAGRAIGAFHRAQLPAPLEMEVRPGVRLGRRAEPLRRVGVYAPGGRASYPSSVLMGVVPARVAEVDEVVVCSPPGPDGRPPAEVLAACAIAGADRVFALGGAGAIAAMAHGTETVPRVDKVVGPGNAFVNEAKRLLTGQIGIDCPAGPSEVLILADSSADPEIIALELIAQAEHDPDAAAILVTTDPTHLAAVRSILGTWSRTGVPAQTRAAIVLAAIAARGGLLVAEHEAEACAFATEWAPEHLLLLVREPRAALEKIRCAGSTFLGPASSVVFGDYMTGANHVLPTGGLARAYGGLSTLDFVRWSTWQELTPGGAAALAERTATLAVAEGLPGHAEAARRRANGGPSEAVQEAPPPGAATIRTRVSYRGLRPYDPGRLPAPIDLSDNTNLFGPPPSVAAVLSTLPGSAITRYPSVYATELKKAIARQLGVAPENVTTGAGSDDVIDSALRAFCEPGDGAAYPVPTFGVVKSFIAMNAAVPLEVPLCADFSLDVAGLLATNPAAIYLCSPNNPTGNAFGRAALERVMRAARGVVIIDEAYADFADDNVLASAVASERAIVLRTLSKAYGLAGLRIGIAVGPAHLIAEVEKSRGPYKVSAIAEAAALAVLRNDCDWVERTIAVARQNRDTLADALRGRGLRVWPSAANFLLVETPPELGGSVGVAGGLRRLGVQVRPFPGLPIAGDAIRVSIGPWSMLERFLAAFDNLASA